MINDAVPAISKVITGFSETVRRVKNFVNNFIKFFTQTVPNGIKGGINTIIGFIKAIIAFVAGVNSIILA